MAANITSIETMTCRGPDDAPSAGRRMLRAHVGDRRPLRRLSPKQPDALDEDVRGACEPAVCLSREEQRAHCDEHLCVLSAQCVSAPAPSTPR